MATSISLVTTFLALVDSAYKELSKTARMDALTQDTIDFQGKSAVKIMKIATVGLGTYSRSAGYKAGDIQASWETMTLSCERGRQFTLDRMDNDESLSLLLGNVIADWMRMYVVPEIDAYRFAAIAGTSNIQAASSATLTSSTILSAIDAASLALDVYEVPAEGRLLYISETCKRYLDAAVTRVLSTERSVDRRLDNLDGIEIIPVPQSRFYTEIDLDAGTTSDVGGYSKTSSTGKDLNFMLVHPSSVVQAVKLNQVKYFSPDVNQGTDGHLWQYRLYHDAFVEDNKVKAVYIHNKA
jgi:hypothetical protein